MGQERENIVGALYSERHATKRHVDAIKIAKHAGYKIVLLNKDIKNPDEKKLNKWYNRIKVWISPTELEGLHNPPMESSLAGCALVSTDHKKAGMGDYSINGRTSLVYAARELKEAASYVKRLMTDEDERVKLNGEMVDLLNNKIGDRKTNMGKMVSLFSK